MLRTDAEAGDAVAQCNQGWIYYKNGADQDFTQALYWTLALQRRATDAQHTLGIMHHFGQGTPQSYPLAAKWIKRAADAGNPTAQHVIGQMLQNGQGVEKDEAPRGELL